MEVIIFMIVLCFLFSSQKKKSQKVGKKETPVQNRPGDRLSSADTEQTGK